MKKIYIFGIIGLLFSIVFVTVGIGLQRTSSNFENIDLAVNESSDGLNLNNVGVSIGDLKDYALYDVGGYETINKTEKNVIFSPELNKLEIPLLSTVKVLKNEYLQAGNVIYTFNGDDFNLDVPIEILSIKKSEENYIITYCDMDQFSFEFSVPYSFEIDPNAISFQTIFDDEIIPIEIVDYNLDYSTFSYVFKLKIPKLSKKLYYLDNIKITKIYTTKKDVLSADKSFLFTNTKGTYIKIYIPYLDKDKKTKNYYIIKYITDFKIENETVYFLSGVNQYTILIKEK